jgi:ABC-type glutathione transport system ATPase component
MADAALLEVKDLNGWYGESHVLHGMNFSVPAGEVVTLLGRNGAGKTTTMRAIMGMLSKLTDAEANVIVLVGERGRELAEFLNRHLDGEQRSLDLERRAVDLRPVRSRRLRLGEHTLGYLRITQFSEPVPEEVQEALADLKAKGVI